MNLRTLLLVGGLILSLPCSAQEIIKKIEPAWTPPGFELLDINGELAEALRNNDSQAFVDAAERAPGYQPLAMVAHHHAVNGMTSIEEILRLAGQVREDIIDQPALTLDIEE